MNCIFSIDKNFSDLIFNKTKPMEFRNVLPKIEVGDKIFIYETKKHGCGMVVGYFTVKSFGKIPHSKVGTYIYIDTYADMFCDDETKRLIKKAKSIELKGYYNSLTLDYIFMEDKLDFMLETHTCPKTDFSLSREEWLKENAAREKNHKLSEDCDNWLSKIGFYDEYDEANWKYHIWVDKVEKFDTPIPITEFSLLDGRPLKAAPQSFCYTSNN